MRKQVYFNHKPATNRQTNIQAYKAQPQTRAITGIKTTFVWLYLSFKDYSICEYYTTNGMCTIRLIITYLWPKVFQRS